MSIVYLNGKYIAAADAKISVFDRGFMFADSLYEVIPVYAGRAFCLDKHLQRLQYGLDDIALAPLVADIDLQLIINEVIARNGDGDQVLYLQVTRGVTAQRDHQLPTNTQATVLVSSSPLATTLHTVDDLTSITAMTCNDIRWQRCDLKSTALLANVLLRQQAVDRGFDEAILINDNEAIEGAASNLFTVVDGIIRTAPKGPKILAGITRDLLIEVIGQCGLAFEERAVTTAELYAASEIWMSSSTKEIKPVVTLDKQTVGNGQIGLICKQLTAAYLQYKKQWI